MKCIYEFNIFGITNSTHWGKQASFAKTFYKIFVTRAQHLNFSLKQQHQHIKKFSISRLYFIRGTKLYSWMRKIITQNLSLWDE